MIKGVLEGWGFPVLEERENNLMFRYQMSYIQVNIMTNDEHAVAVTLSGLFKAENEKETRVCLRTCNFVNWQLMQVKCYLDSDNDMIIASEFFLNAEEDAGFILNKALESVVTAKKTFTRKYREFDEEDTMMASMAEEPSIVEDISTEEEPS